MLKKQIKEKLKLFKIMKFIFRTIGFCLTVGCVSLGFFIFSITLIYGGIILYEINSFISCCEIIFVIWSMSYLLYEFKTIFWDKYEKAK